MNVVCVFDSTVTIFGSHAAKINHSAALKSITTTNNN